MTRLSWYGFCLGVGLCLGLAGGFLVGEAATRRPPCRPCPIPSFHHGPRR